MKESASPAVDAMALARSAMERCAQLAEFSEVEGATTRTFLSPAMHEVHGLLRVWMERLGMEARVDAMGNLRGVYAGRETGTGKKRLLIGSHVDTVPNAGAYDGVLGVAMGLALVEGLAGRRLGYDIEVVAFSEEEGVRFSLPFLGSRALVGDVDQALLGRRDANGVSVAEAIRDFGLDDGAMALAEVGADAAAYIEFHIEQGPVLEDLGLKLGVVEAIAGQSRLRIVFKGSANHAGTTPMRLRRDALAGAAEWMVAVERMARETDGLVATVGKIEARPGAGNVVPGEAELSLDVRHAFDVVRKQSVARMMAAAREVCGRRGLMFEETVVLDQAAVAMDAGLTEMLSAAAAKSGEVVHRMTSGAGHDAMVMARRVPSAMLFLRSPGGVSHHPEEAALLEDIAAGLAAGLEFLARFDAAHSGV